MNWEEVLHRRSIRLPGYDYSQPGSYAITICSYHRECLFGRVVDEQTELSPYGSIVLEEWYRTAEMRPAISLDEFGIMPNHVHGIIVINDVGAHCMRPSLPVTDDRGACNAPLQRPPASLPSTVGGFKSAVTSRVNALRGTTGLSAWQRNYYEHIIRNGEELEAIRAYIRGNARKWAEDRENPANSPGARRLRGEV